MPEVGKNQKKKSAGSDGATRNAPVSIRKTSSRSSGKSGAWSKSAARAGTGYYSGGKRRAGNRHRTGSRSVRKTKKSRKIRIGFTSIFIILLLIFAFIIFNNIERKEFRRGAGLPEGDYIYGIDISHNNRGKIVWDSLYVLADGNGRTINSVVKAKTAHPVRFIIVKATEGKSMKDSRFRENWENAEKHGYKKGAYHFFRSSKDALHQARNFISTVPEIPEDDFPPILDIETIHKGCTKAELNAKALLWLQTVEAEYGRKPIVYSYDSFARDNLSRSITENYPLWIARYNLEDLPETSDWKIWQFTDKAVVYGIGGDTDLNVMRK